MAKKKTVEQTAADVMTACGIKMPKTQSGLRRALKRGERLLEVEKHANRFGAYDPVCATRQPPTANDDRVRTANTDKLLKPVHDIHVARLVDELQDESARQRFVERYFADVDALIEEVIKLRKQLWALQPIKRDT